MAGWLVQSAATWRKPIREAAKPQICCDAGRRFAVTDPAGLLAFVHRFGRLAVAGEKLARRRGREGRGRYSGWRRDAVGLWPEQRKGDHRHTVFPPVGGGSRCEDHQIGHVLGQAGAQPDEVLNIRVRHRGGKFHLDGDDAPVAGLGDQVLTQIGRASCRERV